MKIAFTPAVYEHAASLVGRSPGEVSRDPNLLFAGHQAAYRAYHHSPIVVGIDIYNLEAEAYGAKITVPEGNGIPAIHEPLFASLDQALGLPPFDPARDGRLAMVAFLGFLGQYGATGKTPLAALSEHLANPWATNVATNGVSIPGL